MTCYELADALKAALHNSGCWGNRRDVKFALAQLTPQERALLSKLVARSAKRYDREENEYERR